MPFEPQTGIEKSAGGSGHWLMAKHSASYATFSSKKILQIKLDFQCVVSLVLIFNSITQFKTRGDANLKRKCEMSYF
jgi:hypothetical protein